MSCNWKAGAGKTWTQPSNNKYNKKHPKKKKKEVNPKKVSPEICPPNFGRCKTLFGEVRNVILGAAERHFGRCGTLFWEVRNVILGAAERYSSAQISRHRKYLSTFWNDQISKRNECLKPKVYWLGKGVVEWQNCSLSLSLRKCARAFCLSLSFSPKPPRRKSADTEDTENTFQLSEMTKF